MTESLAFRLALALAIGLLVGLERGWRDRDDPEGSRTAGIRTFGLSGLLGGLVAALSRAAGGSIVLAAGLVAFTLVLGAFKFREARHDQDFSATTVIAGISVFALGALAVLGDFRIASAAGASVAALLAARVTLHRTLRRMTWIELRSAILLGAMSMIGLSLLPNRSLDPWGGFNPWEVWLLTVLTATISYLGYIAMRLLGAAPGLLVGSLAGGLISSTATVVALARAAQHAGQGRQRAGAAAIACVISLLRVMTLVAIVEASVLPALWPVLLPAAIVLAVFAAIVLSRAAPADAAPEASGNPFELMPLLAFAGLYAAVSTLSAALVARFGSLSLVATSALSGLVDVDVASLSALRLVDHGVSASVAAAAVLAAVSVNAVTRVVLAISLGPKAFWLPFLAATALALAVGLAAFLLGPDASWLGA